MAGHVPCQPPAARQHATAHPAIPGPIKIPLTHSWGQLDELRSPESENEPIRATGHARSIRVNFPSQSATPIFPRWHTSRGFPITIVGFACQAIDWVCLEPSHNLNHVPSRPVQGAEPTARGTRRIVQTDTMASFPPPPVNTIDWSNVGFRVREGEQSPLPGSYLSSPPMRLLPSPRRR